MSDYNWDSTPQQKAVPIFNRGYRKGVRDMREELCHCEDELPPCESCVIAAELLEDKQVKGEG